MSHGSYSYRDSQGRFNNLLSRVMIPFLLSSLVPGLAGAEPRKTGDTHLRLNAKNPTPAIGSATPEPLNWALYERGCGEPTIPSVLDVQCGDYGVFYFFPGPAPGSDPCLIIGKDLEEPPTYNAPSPLIATGDTNFVVLEEDGGGEVSALVIEKSSKGTEQGVEGDIPCAAGSCLSEPGGPTGTNPWLATIDWPDWHGYTISATQKQISGLDVSLFSLVEDSTIGALGTTVGDGHVLVQLCRVTESFYQNATPPPKAINMSFGRRALSDEDQQRGFDCLQDGLPCQTKRVIDHLETAGVHMLAAAGNHGLETFPALYPAIRSVGGLDMAWFDHSNGQVRAAWESPEQVDAFLPAYGICLTHGEGLWPAPPGSSYASAILTGWLGAVADEVDLILEEGVSPTWDTAQNCYQLAGNPTGPCVPAIDEILNRLRGHDNSKCWQTEAKEPTLTLQIVPEAKTEAEAKGGAMTLDQWVETHHPAPRPEFCIPCTGGGGAAAKSKGIDLGTGPVKASNAAEGNLYIDLSGYAPELGTFSFGSLFFRVGEFFYPLLDRADPEDEENLDTLGTGEFRSLTIEGLKGLIPAGSQPSIFLTICEDTHCYWSSIPVLIV